MATITTTTFNSTAIYSCDTGYTLNGGSTRTCQSDRTWSGSAPTCEGELDNCLYSVIIYTRAHKREIVCDSVGPQ